MVSQNGCRTLLIIDDVIDATTYTDFRRWSASPFTACTHGHRSCIIFGPRRTGPDHANYRSAAFRAIIARPNVFYIGGLFILNQLGTSKFRTASSLVMFVRVTQDPPSVVEGLASQTRLHAAKITDSDYYPGRSSWEFTRTR